jgi:phytoene dehydrogenase-like protein
MTNSNYDAIVIGAGHNGLVCASYLAKSGRKVLVVESSSTPGGAAATRKFAEGYQVSSGAHLLTQLNPQVSKDLSLERHGLKLAARDLKTIALGEDGNHIGFDGANLTGVSADDQAAYAAFYSQNLKFAKVLNGFFSKRPPSLVDRGWGDNLSLLKLGWDVRSLGKNDMQDLLRVGLINMYDVANEHFDSELLKAAVSMDGVLGSHMGPRSPNTVYGYLYRHLSDLYGMKGPAVVAGGMGAVGAAFAAAAEAAGVEVRYNSAVANVVVEDSRAAGVTLASGETLRARTIISNADPKTTLAKLVGYRELDAGFARRVENFRSHGVAAKLHLALDGLPQFSGLDDANTGDRLLLAPTMDYIELAFNHAKYGEYSEAPAMEINIPTVHDKSLAPEGKHVLSAIVQYAPYELRAGWDNGREAFKQIALDRLAAYAPGIKSLVSASELSSPKDLEAEFGMTGGHWHHGELSLDQALMMRPMPGANQYATPVDGLYLCGAGAHPGGGVMGLAGRNAAKEVIKQEKAA